MTTTAHGLKERLRDELRRYLVVSASLYVCFGVLVLYEATQPQVSMLATWMRGM